MSGNKKPFSFSLSDLDSEKELKTDGCFSMPAAGNRNNSDLNNAGSNGNYWSSTANDNNNSYNLNFNSGNYDLNNNNRNNGFTVRPVSVLTFMASHCHYS